MGPSANAPQVARRGVVSVVVHGRRRIAGRVGPRPTAADAEDFGRQGRPKSMMALILDGFHRRFRAESILGRSRSAAARPGAPPPDPHRGSAPGPRRGQVPGPGRNFVPVISSAHGTGSLGELQVARQLGPR